MLLKVEDRSKKWWRCDTPPNSLNDSNASSKVKTIEEEGVGVCSLGCSILGVRRACWSLVIGIRTNDKWVNYSYGPAQTK
jgi:hypothetical protein